MSKRPYFVQELLRAKKNDVPVSVYFSPEDREACATGYVLEANDDGVTLRHFTTDGAPDGKVLIRMDAVFMVDVGGRYQTKVAFLAQHYQELFGENKTAQSAARKVDKVKRSGRSV